MVTDLAGMVLLPTRPTEGVMSTPSEQVFATMEFRAVFELLGIVAALIENVLAADTRAAGAHAPDARWPLRFHRSCLVDPQARRPRTAIAARQSDAVGIADRACHPRRHQSGGSGAPLPGGDTRARAAGCGVVAAGVETIPGSSYQTDPGARRTVCGTAAHEAFFGDVREAGRLPLDDCGRRAGSRHRGFRQPVGKTAGADGPLWRTAIDTAAFSAAR